MTAADPLPEYEALRDRLRGKYPIGPKLPSGEPEFGYRQFPVPNAIQIEAADALDKLIGLYGIVRGAELEARDALTLETERAETAEAQVRALTRERDEARASLALHCSCDEDAPHKPDCIVVLRDTMRGMEQELDERDEARAEVARRDDFLSRSGYRRCDIPACNCNSWHGGHAQARLSELCAELGRSDALAAVREREAELERLRAAALKYGNHADECEETIDGSPCDCDWYTTKAALSQARSADLPSAEKAGGGT